MQSLQGLFILRDQDRWLPSQAQFWMSVVTELKSRGVSDIAIACVDGLRGFPEAIEAIFPNTQVQLCMVHMVRHSLSYVSHRDRKQVAEDLKAIYQAMTLSEVEHQLTEFEQIWTATYPVIAKSCRTNWSRIVPMFGYPSEIRRAVYTTNTIESLNMTLRKITKNQSLFPKEIRFGIRNRGRATEADNGGKAAQFYGEFAPISNLKLLDRQLAVCQ